MNNWSVETYPITSKPGANLYNTIIYDKKKDKYYRIAWGEIADADNVYHLWYNDTAKEVQLNKSTWKKGWFTKEEIRNIDVEESNKKGTLNMNNYLLHNIEYNFVNENISKSETGEKISKGETWYSIKKTIEAMKDNKSVLFFPIGITEKEVIIRIKKVLTDTRISSWLTKKNLNEKDKNKLIDDFIKNSNLIIDENNLIDNNYIVKKMRKQSNTEKGLDFVVIDGINLVVDDTELDNSKEFEIIQNLLENVNHELKCQTLITIKSDKDI